MKRAASFVIPTCNRVEELWRLIHSLLDQTVAVEILVMDDGNSDRTEQMVKQKFSQARYYRIASGRGPAFQRNRGIELASSNIVFSVDDDTLFIAKDTIEQTICDFDNPRIGAVGIPYINVRHDRVVRQRSPDTQKTYVAHAYVGAAHAIRRDLFLKLGGYREHFFYMGEEGDLCLRMLSAGYVTRLGRADAIHHLESIRRDDALADHCGRRNDVLFAWHNTPLPFLPVHLLATTLNGLRLGLQLGRPWQMMSGLGNGYASSVRHWSGRRPVSVPVFRLFRTLKKRGPQLLDRIEDQLMSIGAVN